MTLSHIAMIIVLIFTIYLMQGRIMSKRSSSSKLFFFDMHGDGAKLQVMADARCSSQMADSFIYCCNWFKWMFSSPFVSDQCWSAAVSRAWKNPNFSSSIPAWSMEILLVSLASHVWIILSNSSDLHIWLHLHSFIYIFCAFLLFQEKPEGVSWASSQHHSQYCPIAFIWCQGRKLVLDLIIM